MTTPVHHAPDIARRARAPRDLAPALLTVAEVADRLGVSVRWVWTRISLGHLRRLRLSPRVTRIEESEFIRFVQEARSRAKE